MTVIPTRIIPAPVTRALHAGWTLRAAAGPAPDGLVAAGAVTATVPGCVHTDLLAAGLIPDPYLDDNEALLAWIGLVDWTYETSFEWAPDAHERHDLVFDGLDTVATVRLNGHVVLESANQHRSFRVDVRETLVEGANTLEVAFRSPIRYANAQSLELGARPRPYPLPYEAIRKSASNFGWDWGIATYTSGIWRPVRLESWSTARIAEARFVASPVGEGGRLEVSVEIERADAAGTPLSLAAEIAGHRVELALDAGVDSAHLAVEMAEALRWWPVGHGAQPLYEASVSLLAGDAGAGDAGAGDAGAGDAGDATVLDSVHRRVGFRTVRWEVAPDDAGTPFTLVVNERPIFVKGVNWIPDDALPVRVDRARYERRLRQAVAANLNLVRVWGGGIYESEDFYELCDELGLLTWQDFLFACAAYPEEEPLRGEIEAEAREQIARLSSHASLVLLTGNNENLWGHEDWGWKRALDGKTWGAYYYHELFPALVAELAPHVPYSPGSPFSPVQPDGAAPHPNAEPHGTMHLWEQWNRQDYLTYRDHRPRFVAEFGWQGPPAWSTLLRSVSDDPLSPESPGMIVHQKAAEGNAKLTNGLLPHFRVPADMETWHWAMQLNQANAVRVALEHFRSWAPHTMGAVVWQLNDCWPVTSWAAIDGDERLKPLWHALKLAFAPRIVTVQPRGDGLAVVLSNDTDAAWTGELVVARRAFDGAEIATRSVPFEVPAGGTVTAPIDAELVAPGDAAAEFIVATALTAAGATAGEADERGFWFFAEPRDSRLPEAGLSFDTEAVDGGTLVRVTATTLVRDLSLLVDKADPDASTEDGLVTLMPGETTVFLVRHAHPIDPAALTSARVVRTANELVAR
ncbi:glycoside hydrolase family 2 protein [Agromyces sp. Leaf222]|uniref:glycoside hydrolase family 2 protein n=1 Tax=Agromyces sp. Leaf222 TaxID=1735688 RepID=UPI000B188DEE|nr:glycoside hydrolase family 2 protein [Agromyces sp. Leaf222]